jgi:glycosyltransferase involved in cell wall biosynthesis
VLPGGAPAQTPLEAMATGAPVVGAPALAAEIGATPGHELVVGEGPAAWAGAMLGLLDDPPYRGRVGRAGRRLVELRHSPQAVAVALGNVHHAAIGEGLAAWRLEVGLDGPRREEG